MLNGSLLGEQAVVDPVTGRIRTRSVRTIALLGLLVARTGAPRPPSEQGAVVSVTRCFDSTGCRCRPYPCGPRVAGRRRPSVPASSDESAAQPLPVDVQEANDGWQRHRFFEGVGRALLAASRPTLLVLDNVQWCDQGTLSFTTFLLNLAPRAPVLFAVTARPDPDGINPATGAWIERRETGVLTEVGLAPLDIAQTAALAGSVTGRVPEGADAALLQDATGGFPLFVVKAARPAATVGSCETGVSAAWSDILRRRLLQASPAALRPDWRPPWSATSRSPCWWKPATWTPTPWWSLWTSSGGTGSCGLPGAAKPCRRVTRRCPSTRSTARPAASATPTPRSPTATEAGRA